MTTPERRLIVKALIRLGSLGLVSVIASLVLSFTGQAGEDLVSLLAILAGGTLIVLLARSSWLNRLATPAIEHALSWVSGLELTDYTQMLRLRGDDRVAEVAVSEGDWLAHETPANVDLSGEGVVLLGIKWDDNYIGAPGPDAEMRPGDTLVLYGREDRLQELSERARSDEDAHREALAEHARVREELAEIER